MAENADGEIDENFWAQAAADRADIDEGEGMSDRLLAALTAEPRRRWTSTIRDAILP